LFLAVTKHHALGALVKFCLRNSLLRTETSSRAIQARRKLTAKKLLLSTLTKQVAKRRLSRLLLLQPELRRLRGRARASTRLLRQHQSLCLGGRQATSRGQLGRRSRLRCLKRLTVLQLSKAQTATLGLRPQRIRKSRLLCTYATRSLKRTERFALCAGKRGTRLRASNLRPQSPVAAAKLLAGRVHVLRRATCSVDDRGKRTTHKGCTAKDRKSYGVHSYLH
jgi:hypothetical protein